MPLIKVFDWIMEASTLFYFQRDTFYRAAIIISVLYEKLGLKKNTNEK